MKRFLLHLREAALLMIGQPSYERYRQHLEDRHPERQPMSRTEFFRNREAARYGSGGGGRCC
ncbi:MAG: YbdD/YjiX family protein [Novosphingobium sp.]